MNPQVVKANLGGPHVYLSYTIKYTIKLTIQLLTRHV